MNDAHIHLLVNHVSLFSIAFGAVALAWALIRHSKEMRYAAIILFLIAGAFGWITMETGESAEDLVEDLPGVTRALIHEHEEAAEYANISATVVAVGALLLMGISRYKPKFTKTAQVVLLILAILSAASMARTAFLGGLVRHTEIRKT